MFVYHKEIHPLTPTGLDYSILLSCKYDGLEWTKYWAHFLAAENKMQERKKCIISINKDSQLVYHCFLVAYHMVGSKVLGQFICRGYKLST